GTARPVGHDNADRLARIVVSGLRVIARCSCACKCYKSHRAGHPREDATPATARIADATHFLTYLSPVPLSYVPTKTLPPSSAATDSPQLLLAAPVPSLAGAGSGMKAVTLPSFTLPILTPRLKPGFCALLDSESVT